LSSMLDDHSVLVTGDGKQKLRQALEEAPVRALERFHFVGDHLSHCSAETVGLLGERMLMSGETADSVTAEPMYIKEFYTKAG
ncbi:MAG: hypothetical protein OEM41_07115, partial [Ignavibacteria bacterium]|nr:hypothetical protein [Ignavibacteria bacterium]